MIRALILVLWVATPATAQDLVFDSALVDACYATARDNRPDCIGEAGAACQAGTLGGYTITGVSRCFDRETDEWDRLLNLGYGLLREKLEALDTGVGIDRSDALRDAQRAWIAFRDAECNLEWSLFREGTSHSPIAIGCVLDFTANRALDLRALRLERDP